MQIMQIPDDQYAKLTAVAQAAGYDDLSAFINALANKPFADSFQNLGCEVNLGTTQQMPEHLSIDELAVAHGIKPVQDFRDLKAHFFPPGETTDQFLSFLRSDNFNDVPRVR